MIYRSNLSAPDLTPYFKLTEFDFYGGHTFLADPDFDPRCGFFTHDEAALLYNIAVVVTRYRSDNTWLDIGARTGWTAAHIIAGGGCVMALEPEQYREDFHRRTLENVGPVIGKYQLGRPCFRPFACTSEEFFKGRPFAAPKFDGFVIDGNHDVPEPLRDAMWCYGSAKLSAVFVIHDFLGPATWQAAEYLLDRGCNGRVYWTANCTAVCWRGFDGWKPPDHRPDPEIVRMHKPRVPGKLLARCV